MVANNQGNIPYIDPSLPIPGSAARSYLSSVLEVRKADVKDGIIDLSPARGTRLTLVTCDALTGETARFIVEAEFVGSY